MIKSLLILTAAAASLGASTQTPQTPPKAVHFEISAGPLHWTREDGAVDFSITPEIGALLSIKIGDRTPITITL